MAPSTDTQIVNTSTPPDRPNPARGGNRGRGGSRQSQHTSDTGRGGGRVRGGNQNARRRGGSQSQNNDRGKLAAKDPEPTPAATKPTEQKNVDADAEGELCFICASPVQHTAVAPCNHRSCHICSLRLRALYKTKTCAHCRVCDIFLSCIRRVVDKSRRPRIMSSSLMIL